MAIGDTVQAGLMRVDFSPIARAGEAQARGNQAFGLGFERMVDRFNQRVKEKQAKEERDRAYRLQKMIADRNFEMQVGQLGLQQAAAEQSMAAKAKADQLADKAMQDKVALSNFLMSGTEMDPEVVEDFNQAQPGLFALGGDEGARNRFLEYQRDTAPKTGPLGGELGSSDFARFAKEQGLDPVLAGNYFMNLQKAEAEAELANQPKPLSPSDQLAREEFEYKKSQDLNKPIPLTEGEKSRDRKFADQLVEFNLPDINKGLEQLTEASEALSKSNTLTGPIVSLMPNFVGDRVNPKAAEVREAVEEVVQRNLRLVLGAQFTEKEGERLISRAYNPTLDEAENKKRVERLIKSIRDAAQEKLNMKSYFEKNGTLKGYDSNQPSIESIEQSAFGESAPASQSILDEIERKKQLRSKRAGL